MSDETTGGSAPAATTAEPSTESKPAEAKPVEAKATPTPEQKRKMKLKVNDVEEELDEDEVIRWAQKGRGADKKFNEAAMMRKQSEELVRKLMDDDSLEELLMHPVTGRDAKRLKTVIENIHLKILQDEMMDPKDKELLTTKKELEKYRAQEKKKQEAEEAAKKEAAKNQMKEDYSKVMIGALEKSGLPKSEWTVNRLVGYMDRAVQHGYDLDEQDLADLVKRDFIKETKEAYGHLPEDQLMSIFGDDLVKKLKSADVKKVKGFQNNLDKPLALTDAEDRRTKKKHMSKDELRALVQKRMSE